MSLTTLDPNTALIVIDLLNGIAAMPAEYPTDVIAKSASLAEAFRRHSLPVILVKVNPGATNRTDQPRRMPANLPADWGEVVSGMNQQPSDHVVTKRNWGAFTNTGLADYLHANSVTQVVIVGIATSIGVESTARQANELGFHVTLPTDAMTDLHLDAHANSLTRIFPRIAETGTTAEVLALLETTR